MGNEPQTLTEMPLWVLILLAALGGVSGEMWRADKPVSAAGPCCGAWRCAPARRSSAAWR
ncbi:hypothetical protein AM469_000636 [Pseudomonas aeruginosa]|nr:hypothetical protein AM469_000636 [Pseudomonas aeruginosa]